MPCSSAAVQQFLKRPSVAFFFSFQKRFSVQDLCQYLHPEIPILFVNFKVKTVCGLDHNQRKESYPHSTPISSVNTERAVFTIVEKLSNFYSLDNYITRRVREATGADQVGTSIAYVS